jgi:hypothetical protein
MRVAGRHVHRVAAFNYGGTCQVFHVQHDRVGVHKQAKAVARLGVQRDHGAWFSRPPARRFRQDGQFSFDQLVDDPMNRLLCQVSSFWDRCADNSR